jgi:hypothetical protein
MKKTTEPVRLFTTAERQAALADIVKFILNRRKARLVQVQVKNTKGENQDEKSAR